MTAAGPAVPVRLPAALTRVAWWQQALLVPGVLVIGLAGWRRLRALIAVIGHARGEP